MSATSTYTKLIEIGELTTLRVGEHELRFFPAQAGATKKLVREAVYREVYADNPADSDSAWGGFDSDVVSAEPDQLVARDPRKKALVYPAAYVINVPVALGGLPVEIADWLQKTHDAATIDSMWRLATDYVQTVTEMYNERTTK